MLSIRFRVAQVILECLLPLRRWHRSGVALAALIAATLPVTCTPDYAECVIKCADDGSCPSGLSCSRGLCTRGGVCDRGPVDARASDAAMPDAMNRADGPSSKEDSSAVVDAHYVDRRQPQLSDREIPDASGKTDAADAHETTDADAHGQREASVRHCNPNGAFGEPRSPGLAFGVGGYSDEGVSLSPDELTAYFASTREDPLGDYHLFVAKRASTADSFDHAEPITGGVNTASTERMPSISPDGRWLFYSDMNDIFLAKRETDTGPFGPGSPVENVNTAQYIEREPFFARDGKSLYFVSDRSTPNSIYVSVLDDSGRFSDPSPVFPSSIHAEAPTLSDDELTMFFQNGSANVSVHRESVAESFSSNQPVLLDSANTLGIKWPEAISRDGCTLYFVAFVVNDAQTFSWRVVKMATRSQ